MKTVFAAGLALAVALPCSAQPHLTNGRVTERPLSGALQPTVRALAGAPGPVWIAWAAPVVDGRQSLCCFHGDWYQCVVVTGSCSLEPGGTSTISTRRDAVALEPPDTFFVFLRVENRRIERVRIFSADCALDAGGREVVWLTGVRPTDSVAYLAELAAGAPDDRAAKGAIAALAQHGIPEAVPPLLRLARHAPAARTRADALFWLAQRAGERAAATIAEAIEHDPETDVKKRAVFALSQLPAGEGVPKLIEVARTNRNPAVRKQAMFWLGQSKDARAIAFFEEILTR